VVGHTTKQMKHSRSCDIQYDDPTLGPSYLDVGLTTVHHLYNVIKLTELIVRLCCSVIFLVKM